MTDKMTAEQALDAVRNVLQRAYNSAYPVCCGRAGTECCGSPEPEWSEYDQQILTDLLPVEQYLRQALSAPRVPEGWKLVPVEPTPEMAAQTAYDGTHYSDPFDFEDFKKDYAAMLAAAPSPEGQEAELEALREDAARWRYIRRKLCLTGNGDGTCAMQAINLPAAIQGWPEPGQVAEFCDAAIDEAMAEENSND